ncbi:conserved hypothetical protein [Trichinella spiralis]|uniref:hypothetical protein n=1 Tax=Trichinella spiralis TaxID=6334 RepID=UPI0001EFD5A3|nr:conserved hypothetical protein [Trichinella spiralis]
MHRRNPRSTNNDTHEKNTHTTTHYEKSLFNFLHFLAKNIFILFLYSVGICNINNTVTFYACHVLNLIVGRQHGNDTDLVGVTCSWAGAQRLRVEQEQYPRTASQIGLLASGGTGLGSERPMQRPKDDRCS